MENNSENINSQLDVKLQSCPSISILMTNFCPYHK